MTNPQIDFRNTLFDLVRFNLYHFPRSRVTQVLLAGALLLFGRDAMRVDAPLSARIVMFLILAVGLVVACTAIIIVVAVFSYRPKKNKGILSEHHVSLTSEGVVEETPVSTSKWAWSAVPRIARTRSYIYIYVQQNMAHVIPARAFRTDAEAAQFFDSAMALWKAPAASS